MKYTCSVALLMVLASTAIPAQAVITRSLHLRPGGRAEVPFTISHAGPISVQVQAYEARATPGMRMRVFVSLAPIGVTPARAQTDDWSACSVASAPSGAPTGGAGGTGSRVRLPGKSAPPPDVHYMCTRINGIASAQDIKAAPNWVVVIRDSNPSVTESVDATVTIKQAGAP